MRRGRAGGRAPASLRREAPVPGSSLPRVVGGGDPSHRVSHKDRQTRAQVVVRANPAASGRRRGEMTPLLHEGCTAICKAKAIANPVRRPDCGRRGARPPRTLTGDHALLRCGEGRAERAMCPLLAPARPEISGRTPRVKPLAPRHVDDAHAGPGRCGATCPRLGAGTSGGGTGGERGAKMTSRLPEVTRGTPPDRASRPRSGRGRSPRGREPERRARHEVEVENYSEHGRSRSIEACETPRS